MLVLKTLLLIRHTETEYLAKAPSSKLPNDASLSDAGRTHALNISQELSSYSVELVASSLYRRSQQTAEILNAHWQAKSCATAALNEYFLREDGSGVESVEEGFVRVSTVPKSSSAYI